MGLVIERTHLKQYKGNETHVVIPDTVRIIDDYAFSYASSLVSVTIPDSVEEIGTRAFYACENLQEVQMPDSVRYLGSGAFVRCTGLRAAKLPMSLTAVPDSTFYGCTALREVILPERCTRIGVSAFEQCVSLQEAILPSSLISLEKKAFFGCTALARIELPEGLTAIREAAFCGCSSLGVLDVPASVQQIEKAALDTQGRITLRIPALFVTPDMLDEHWNLAWGYDKDHNRPYQLDHAYLPHVSLAAWKPAARCSLAVCYLETYREPVSEYDSWIRQNVPECMTLIVQEKRWDALHGGMHCSLFCRDDILPYLDHIHDPVIRAEILSSGSAPAGSLLDLF